MSKLKFALPVAFATLVGCSTVTDHGLDYQAAQVSETSLVLPEGIAQSEDKLVIPNEDRVAELNATGEFSAPKAATIYRSLGAANIQFGEDSVLLQFKQPSDRVSSALKAYWRDNFELTLSESDTAEGQKTLLTDAVQLKEQGSWAALWSKITRLYPDKYQLQYVMSASATGTDVVVSVKKITTDGAGEWFSPEKDELTYRELVRSWSRVGRRSLDNSALLSEQSTTQANGLFWVDHNRFFALKLSSANLPKEAALSLLETQFGLRTIPQENSVKVALVGEDQVAKVGDIVDFTMPNGAGETVTLFKVRRRNLDDVSWKEREYSIELHYQANGTFVRMDTSADSNPELTSFRLVNELTQR